MDKRKPVKRPVREHRPLPGGRTYLEMAATETTVKGLQMLWRNAKDQDELTEALDALLRARAAVLKTEK